MGHSKPVDHLLEEALNEIGQLHCPGNHPASSLQSTWPDFYPVANRNAVTQSNCYSIFDTDNYAFTHANLCASTGCYLNSHNRGAYT